MHSVVTAIVALVWETVYLELFSLGRQAPVRDIQDHLKENDERETQKVLSHYLLSGKKTQIGSLAVDYKARNLSEYG